MMYQPGDLYKALIVIPTWADGLDQVYRIPVGSIITYLGTVQGDHLFLYDNKVLQTMFVIGKTHLTNLLDENE